MECELELKLDDTKTYTYGDWVRGTVSIDATYGCIREIQVELREMMTLSDRCCSEQTLYVLKSDVKNPRFGQPPQEKSQEKSLEFAIQFPEHKKGTIIPSTLENPFTTSFMEIRHTITVKVVTGKLFKRVFRNSKELQFMHTESVKLLSAPNEVCNEQNCMELPAVARLELPPYLAQDGVNQKVFITLLASKSTGLQIISAQAFLHWRGRNYTPAVSIGFEIAKWDFTPKPENCGAIEETISLPMCPYPVYKTDDVDCGYTFEAQVNIFDPKAGRSQSLTFSKPVSVLPKRLHKDEPGCFATKDEMRDLISAKEGRSSIAAVEDKDTKVEASPACVPSYTP